MNFDNLFQWLQGGFVRSSCATSQACTILMISIMLWRRLPYLSKGMYLNLLLRFKKMTCFFIVPCYFDCRRKIVLNMDYPDRMAEHDAKTAKDYEQFEADPIMH
jgi:hypothetical protein